MFKTWLLLSVGFALPSFAEVTPSCLKEPVTCPELRNVSIAPLAPSDFPLLILGRGIEKKHSTHRLLLLCRRAVSPSETDPLGCQQFQFSYWVHSDELYALGPVFEMTHQPVRNPTAGILGQALAREKVRSDRTIIRNSLRVAEGDRYSMRRHRIGWGLVAIAWAVGMKLGQDRWMLASLGAMTIGGGYGGTVDFISPLYQSIQGDTLHATTQSELENWPIRPKKLKPSRFRALVDGIGGAALYNTPGVRAEL